MLPATAFAQPGASVQLDKPKKFEKRTLASEKSTEGKFGIVKRANSDLNTRYNFVFNSERILNQVMANAKASFQDNYAHLLPFFNYSLDGTADQATDIDSVLMKCNDAILLHDLRNDWVGDLYLMMGKSYFYKKNFDSAMIAFQYVNYAFQPRTKDEIGYIKYIGSNLNPTGNVYTISTKEKGNVITKPFIHTPARNESLLWLVRTLIEQDDYSDAWGIIATLDEDVNFPSRLDLDLYELKAYWYYSQRLYDSASHFLIKALPNAKGKLEQSRWEYLIAQLLENVNKTAEADEYYGKVIGHTTDPIMEAYARINQIRIISGGDEEKRIAMNIAELMKMSKRDKYQDYRHIIYYAAAQMELKRNQPEKAIEYLKESAKYSAIDPVFRTATWLLLGDLAFENRLYWLADMGYDSLDISDPNIPDPEQTLERKTLSTDVVLYMETIRIQDSLIHIAGMPEAERNAYVKSLVRKLRKEQGLKEDEQAMAAGASTTVDTRMPGVDAPAIDIFAGNTAKGEWYFYNSSLRAQGYRQFKVNWGNRPNVDNWRRVSGMNLPTSPIDQNPQAVTDSAGLANDLAHPKEYTTEALTANLPLTPEQLKVSNDTIVFAYHMLGQIFREKIGDCESLLKNNEEMLNRYPNSIYTEEAVFGLYYCNQKAGNTAKAKIYKDYLEQHYNKGHYLRMINEPKEVEKETALINAQATKTYEAIYNSFIEGDFNKAIAEKKKADSIYGNHYWTPQLLYIESVYYVKQKDDSLAIVTLKNLMALYPDAPISAKAATMIEVLQRRAEIEEYLTNLDVKRATEDSVVEIEDVVKVKPKEQVENKATRAPVVTAPPKKDGLPTRADTSTFKAPPPVEKKAAGYVFTPTDQHMVVLLLNKVDIVYVNEARNALNRYNKEKFYNTPLEVTNVVLDDNRKMVTIANFANVIDASDYMEKVKTSASTDLFPWMPKDKFSFFIITAANLELLKTKKDVDEYLKLYKQSYSAK